MNTMMIAALLAGAGLAQAGAPTPASQCGPDCDNDCCAVNVVGNVSTGDYGKKVVKKKIVIAKSRGQDAAHGKSKGFMIFIDEDGKTHMKSLDPDSMHEWMGQGDGENKHKFAMKFGMSGDDDGAHGFAAPKDGFRFEWDGEGQPFSFDGMPDEVKKFIIQLKDLKGGSFEGADGAHVFMIPDGEFNWKSDDGDRSFVFKGMPGDLDKFFAGKGKQLHEEVEIQDDRPRLGVSLDPGEEGLVIVDLMDGFPAEHAGLESGDVIVTINGEGPATMDRLREALEYSHIAFGLATAEGKKTVTIRLDGDQGGAKKKPGKARMKFHIQSDDDNHKAREGRHAMELHLERSGEDGDLMEQVKKALHEALGELRGNLDVDAQNAIEEALHSLHDLDIEAIVEGHMGGAGEGRAHRDGDAPRIRARVERLMDRSARKGDVRERVLRRAPRASAPKKPAAPRNRSNDARFKKLEDRLDRIERLLEQIVRQG